MIGHRTHLSINSQGHLEIGGVDTLHLVKEIKTPLYVTDEDRIRQRYEELFNSFSGRGFEIKIKYAYKANTTLAILKLFKLLGAGADVLSEGEILAALKVGLHPRDIIFTGNNKTDDELVLAIDKGITVNIDSFHELERIKAITRELDRQAKVSFRINPSVNPSTHPYLATGLRESKFGIHEREAMKAYKEAFEDRYLSVEGIHMHIGSQILDPTVYSEAASKLMKIVLNLKKELGLDLRFIDLGGGFGIRYKEEDRIVHAREFADALIPTIENAILEGGLKKPLIYIEPGRYIVADSTILLTEVNTVKKTPIRKFIGVNAGFNTLARPMIYNAYHEVVVANRMTEEPKEVITIAGNVCESGDLLARDRNLPLVQEKDVIAFLDAGAYGFSMASNYNYRPRPAVVLAKDGKWMIIRERETIEDIMEKDILPPDLEV